MRISAKRNQGFTKLTIHKSTHGFFHIHRKDIQITIESFQKTKIEFLGNLILPDGQILPNQKSRAGLGPYGSAHQSKDLVKNSQMAQNDQNDQLMFESPICNTCHKMTNWY